ncbi:MAG: hypothetical protein VW683_08910 [Betaproteobacteria bacterium]
MAGGGAGEGIMGRGGGPDVMGVDAFGGKSSRDRDVQEAKNQLMGVISVEEAQRNPQNAIATPASPTGYVSKYGGYGIAKGIEGALISKGILAPKSGPTAPPVVVGGYNPNIGPHYGGPVRDISPRSRTSSGVVATPWGVNPRNPANTAATPTGSFNYDLSPVFDTFGVPIALEAAKQSGTLSPSSLGALSVLGALEGGRFGMGLAADALGIPESVRNVSVEGKGEIPGADVYSGPDMDLNFQGLGPDMDLNFKGMEGVSVDPIGSAILDLDRAFASNYDNPAAYNQSVIDALGKVSSNTAAISRAGGDPTLAVIQREIAQKAAEQLISQEAARNNNVVNIPVAEGPAVNVKITKAPKRPTRGKEAANYIDPGPSPAQIAAASVVADQTQFKKLPKRIQKELRSGRQPTGSDYDVDRAMAIINPPKPSSPMDSRGR